MQSMLASMCMHDQLKSSDAESRPAAAAAGLGVGACNVDGGQAGAAAFL